MWTWMVLSGVFAVAGSAGGNEARVESASFVVVSTAPWQDARATATLCEEWRGKLLRYWSPDESHAAWEPKCLVVVHPGRASYLAAVGSGGAATFGSSLIDFGRNRQAKLRRIDLRVDRPHGMAALPHELTHVVLADLLGGRQPPRWADEGMGLLADSSHKQRLHERDLHAGLASRQAFRLAELFAMETYPHPARVPAFYGQSASVTAFLAQRGKPQQFIVFLRSSLDQGLDGALQSVYAIENVAQLEQLWYEQRRVWPGGFHGLQVTLSATGK